MQPVDVNVLAVFVAAIVSMVLGMIWYSPGVFGKQWMQLSGKTEADLAKMKGMTTTYLLAFLGQLVTAYVFAQIIGFSGAKDIAGGLQAGFWVWLGFPAAGMLSITLWEGKSWALYFLTVAHVLVVLLVTGVLLAVWR